MQTASPPPQRQERQERQEQQEEQEEQEENQEQQEDDQQNQNQQQQQQQLLQWSNQFIASHSPALPGDKIALPQSALEQLLSASSSSSGYDSHSPPYSQHFDPYARLANRQAESQFADQKNQLPNPLTFRLVNPRNGRVIYAGIREFSASDGQVALSEFLYEALGLDDKKQRKSLKKYDDDDDDYGGGGGGGGGDGHQNEDDGGDETEGGSITITVHARQLPRGTYVKLRPLEAGYNPDDWKALLERHLRLNYTTLTNGEVLVVPGAANREEFRFLVDGFKPSGADAICVVDTDLEVDIEALNEEQARETLKRISDKMQTAPGTDHGSTIGGEVDVFRAASGQVLPGEYVDYHLSSWPRAQPLEIELEAASEDGDVDLLVSPFSTRQRARPRLDEHVFGDFGSRPAKRIRLEPTNVELENAEAMWISVYAYAPACNSPTEQPLTTLEPRRYTLRVKAAEQTPATNGPTRTATAEEDQPPNPGDIRCKNCLQWVPKPTLILHENFCLRNNILCPHGCGQVFQKRSPQYSQHWHCPHDTFHGNTLSTLTKHNTLYHPPTPLSCPHCTTSQVFTSLPQLAHHRTSTCPAKPILCCFCHLEMPQEGDPDHPSADVLLSGLTAHELADGARTTECHLCNRITKLKDLTTHLRHHDLERKTRPPPRVCRNINCGRTLDGCNPLGDTRAATRVGQGPGNDIGLCSTCFGPLYVSLYDPENKALKRRIERRYLSQLVSGCGKPWCRNAFCKSGRGNLGLEPAAVGTKDAIPMVKPFIDGSISTQGRETPLHFCTDEQSQKRRPLAELLAAEKGLKGELYGLEWCVGALEAEGGDLERARTWLVNWAPTRDIERGDR